MAARAIAKRWYGTTFPAGLIPNYVLFSLCQSHVRLIWLVAALLLTSAVPVTAQILDPDWNITARDTRLHFAAGALLDVGLQLPLAPRGFRDTAAKRLLVVAVIGLAYEVGQQSIASSLGVSGSQGFGIGPKDLLADVAGAVAIELVIALGRRLR